MAKVSEEIGDQDKFVKDRTVEQVYMRKLMFDLIDVNDGEKEIMKAWNDVIMGHRSVGLKDIPRIVDQFVSEKSELLRRHPRNYALHLCGLEQAGLITPHQVLKSVTATAPAPAHEDGVTMETEPSREPLELGSDARPETLINSEVRRSVRVSLMYEAAPEVYIRVCHILCLFNRFAFSRTEPPLAVLPRLVPSLSKFSRKAEAGMIPFLSVWIMRGIGRNLVHLKLCWM